MGIVKNYYIFFLTLIFITSLLYRICIKKNVTFILNDRVDIAKKLNVDGVHLGKEDGSIKNARNILGNLKIIGSSCYNNKNLSNYQLCLFIAILISLWPIIPTGSFFNNWVTIIVFLPIPFLIQSLKK